MSSANVTPSPSSLRNRRKQLIEKIENKRNSKVLVYFCGDRPNLVAQVASDAVRWIYDHLLSMNQGKEVEQIDLYIYSRGGSLESPWEIITMLRQMCKKLNVLIPYRAHSATTLIALGADRILMGHLGELGRYPNAIIVTATITPITLSFQYMDSLIHILFKMLSDIDLGFLLVHLIILLLFQHTFTFVFVATRSWTTKEEMSVRVHRTLISLATMTPKRFFVELICLP